MWTKNTGKFVRSCATRTRARSVLVGTVIKARARAFTCVRFNLTRIRRYVHHRDILHQHGGLRHRHDHGDAVPQVLLHVRGHGHTLPLRLRDHVLRQLPGVRREEAGREERQLLFPAAATRLAGERVQQTGLSAHHVREVRRAVRDEDVGEDDRFAGHRRSAVRQRVGDLPGGAEFRSAHIPKPGVLPDTIQQQAEGVLPTLRQARQHLSDRRGLLRGSSDVVSAGGHSQAQPVREQSYPQPVVRRVREVAEFRQR